MCARDGEPAKPKKQHYLDMEWFAVMAPETGVFEGKADCRDILSEEQVIGSIKQLDGSVLAEVKSPIDGVVHIMYPSRFVFPRK